MSVEHATAFPVTAQVRQRRERRLWIEINRVRKASGLEEYGLWELPDDWMRSLKPEQVVEVFRAVRGGAERRKTTSLATAYSRLSPEGKRAAVKRLVARAGIRT